MKKEEKIYELCAIWEIGNIPFIWHEQKIVEVESLAELEFLQTISNRFWLGTTRDPDSGLWRWIETGKEVNFAVIGL